ncbi:MAG TPA: arylesterase [Vicinamibacterales bacterium]
MSQSCFPGGQPTMRTFQIVPVAAVLAVTAGIRTVDADQAAVQPAASIRIVALGDSLTSGHRLPRAQAYPAVLEAALKDEGVPAVVVNHGVSGDTTAGGVRRLTTALADRPDVLIVALGVNDGLRGVSVAQVHKNLETIIETARARGVTVLLCAMEALPLHGWQYTVDFHNMYTALAAKHNVSLVPFILMGVLGNPDLMSSDGLHPNAAGARVMASTVLTYVRPLVTPGAATR